MFAWDVGFAVIRWEINDPFLHIEPEHLKQIHTTHDPRFGSLVYLAVYRLRDAVWVRQRDRVFSYGNIPLGDFPIAGP